MDDKKKSELRYLEAVRRGIDNFPPGIVTDSESPDFLIVSSERIVGVEITCIFSPPNSNSPYPQSKDTERNLIADLAQAIATGQSLAPVMVDIYFDTQLTVRMRDRESIAHQLVDLVAANMPGLDEDRSIENRHLIKSQIPPQVEAVHIWRPKLLTSHLWQKGNAGIVNEHFAPHLQQQINDKNDKLATYRGKCDECWLVVVADWRGPSAFLEISGKMAGHNYTTAFDRIYFVECHSGRVVVLNTTTNVG